MAWDSARPVLWKRFAKEGVAFAVGMTAIMYLLAGQRDSGSYLGVLFGALMYVGVVGLMAKFGYVRKTLAELRAEAAAKPPRQVGRTAAAPSTRARPVPTKRTGGTANGKRR